MLKSRTLIHSEHCTVYCILGNYGRNINDFHTLHMPFHRGDLTLLSLCHWRTSNDPLKFIVYFLQRNILRKEIISSFSLTWGKNYQGPFWIVVAKEDWLICFRLPHSRLRKKKANSLEHITLSELEKKRKKNRLNISICPVILNANDSFIAKRAIVKHEENFDFWS